MLDRNGDGLLSADEMPESLRDERAKWDVNGDGFIDLAEWNSYLDAVMGLPRLPAVESVGRANAARDPPVQVPNQQPRAPGAPPPTNKAQFPGSSARPPFNDNPRVKPPAAPTGRYPKNLPAWFKEYDIDGDGQVGLHEWQAKKDILSEFKKYDLNNDGFITVEELVRSGQFLTNTKTPPTVAGLQAEIGDYYYFEVTGSSRGIVWGTDIYTADSQLAVAAVHAGLLKTGETGLIKVTVLPGEERYEGSARNGVTTQNFGIFPRSIRIEAAK